MSIMNVFLRPDRALVGVDTECSIIGAAGHTETTKLFPFAHIHAVFAFRGMVLFGMTAWPILNLHMRDFDGTAEDVPRLLKHASDSASKTCDQVGVSPEDVARAECVLVGFSRKSGQIVGYHYVQESPGAGFTVNKDFSNCYGPDWNDGELDPPNLNISHDKTGMINLSLKQAILLRSRQGPGVAAGGKLIVAEIDRHRITIECLCSFPPRETQ